jgi:hypothetical protein
MLIRGGALASTLWGRNPCVTNEVRNAPSWMPQMSEQSGVIRIRVLNSQKQWVTLPYAFYYGSPHARLGGAMDNGYEHWAAANAEAQKTLKRLRAQNPDREYDIDKAYR